MALPNNYIDNEEELQKNKDLLNIHQNRLVQRIIDELNHNKQFWRKPWSVLGMPRNYFTEQFTPK